MKKLIQYLKTLFNKKGEIQVVYPYKHTEMVPSITDKPVKFIINNTIEEFRLVAWGGEKDYVKQVIESLREDDIFLDVGSSVGLFSVLASFKIKKGSVISIEPDPENILRLKNNILLNALKNNIIIPSAVGDSKGIMRLYTAGSNSFSPSLKKVNGIDNYIEVNVERVDDLINSNQIPYPSVVKIDIEGAEYMALRGMEKLLNSDNRPRLIYIEIHPDFLPSFSANTEDIFQYMKKMNYNLVEKIQRDAQILCQYAS